MRFLVMVKANKDSEAGVLPGAKLLADMGKFNEQLVKAGVMHNLSEYPRRIPVTRALILRAS